mmetsp:Transcript_6644/g.10084  ORF Transcript_6644/g.10084 Transcript_6644/m.10084 type:complete len:91 (-) Transcript_6644:430-702(-)
MALSSCCAPAADGAGVKVGDAQDAADAPGVGASEWRGFGRIGGVGRKMPAARKVWTFRGGSFFGNLEICFFRIAMEEDIALRAAGGLIMA